MEVTHAQDKVSNVVIGGSKAAGFSMNNSAEFFNILSDTLYSNKPEAVVRESLCNGWDSHIASGRTDIPLDVTLSETHMVIRDYGKGIDPDKVVDIYCTYGLSTKKNDGLQTGGFGLGSKSPFAITDHFQSTIHFNGTKTIYNLSKSVAELGGIPGIVGLVSMPTTEEGVELSIPLNGLNRVVFKNLIVRLAALGEMKVRLNGTLLEDTIPFSEAKHSWTMLQNAHLNDFNSIFLVRYGNVVYPIPDHEELRPYISTVNEFMKKLPAGYRSSWRLVFLAPSNSISVTPSRESLSMSPHTVKTLVGLFDVFVRTFNSKLEAESKRTLSQGIEASFNQANLKDFFSTDHKVPGASKLAMKAFGDSPQINEYAQIIEMLAATHYPKFKGFRQHDMESRVDALLRSGFGDRGLIQSYKTNLLREYRMRKNSRLSALSTYTSYSFASNWFHKKIVNRLTQGMKEVGLHPNKLLARSINKDRWGSAQYTLTEASKSKAPMLEACFPYLRKLVILTYRASDAFERASDFPIITHYLGNPENALVYVVPRSAAKVEIAHKHFESKGYTVIDLTVAQKWEEDSAAEAISAPKPVYQKPKGLPVLRSLASANGTILPSTPWEDCPRIEKPLTVIRVAQNGTAKTWDHYSVLITRGLTELFGDVIGVASSTTQEDKYIKEGAQPWLAFITPRVLDQLTKNPRIVDSGCFYKPLIRRDHSYINGGNQELIDIVFSEPILARAMGFRNQLTTTDMFWLTMADKLVSQYDYEIRTKRLSQVPAQILEIHKAYVGLLSAPNKAHVDRFVKLISLNRLLDIFDFDNIKSMLQDSSNSNPSQHHLRRMRVCKALLTVLKG